MNAAKGKMLHREVVWVIFAQFWIGCFASVVVVVGMWATRLRCPSCPQRCDALTPLIARQCLAHSLSVLG
jgi:hypothetical protein